MIYPSIFCSKKASKRAYFYSKSPNCYITSLCLHCSKFGGGLQSNLAKKVLRKCQAVACLFGEKFAVFK